MQSCMHDIYQAVAELGFLIHHGSYIGQRSLASPLVEGTKRKLREKREVKGGKQCKSEGEKEEKNENYDHHSADNWTGHAAEQIAGS